MKRIPLAVTTLSTLAAANAAAQPVAGPRPGEWTGSIAAGTDTSLGGDFHDGAVMNYDDLGILDESLSGAAGRLVINERSFNDIYDIGFGADLEIAYGLSTNAEIFGSVRYANVEADTVAIGAVSIPSLDGNFAVNGDFDDYSSVTAELGYRRYFRTGRRFRPFLAGRVGVAFMDSIDARLTIPEADVALDSLRFYDSTATFSVGAGSGFVYQLTDRLGIGLESVFRYTGELDGDDTGLAPLGLDGLNDDAARLSASGQLRTRYSF